MNTSVRRAKLADKESVLHLLDQFREDCILQITGKSTKSDTAVTGGTKVYEQLLERADYAVFVLTDADDRVAGIITGYLCPMLRSGQYRAEVEEFFVIEQFRGDGNATKLMDAFFEWCQSQGVTKVNLESDNELSRAHGFYKKYGFETKAQRFVKKLS